jgi:PhzF family phenazine biosynthesis protein
MSQLPIYQVDAFTDRPFAGNPAAICLLDDERDASWMQSVADEMNLSETAFVRPLDDGYSLRWFTPTIEVPLCGHATLASAHVLFSTGSVPPTATIRFHTQSGVLTAKRSGELIELDFPATPPQETTPTPSLLTALGLESASYVGKTSLDTYLVVTEPATLRQISPDFRALATLARGVIITAASDDNRFDFLSRFFAPAAGIDEDPVTGSAHCALAPYWSERLSKEKLTGYQASKRGGTVYVQLKGDRVLLAGHAVTVLEGKLVSSRDLISRSALAPGLLTDQL